MLATILRPSMGEARVLGYDVVKEHREVRERIAYLPQGCNVDRNWTPKEAVRWFLVSRGEKPSEAMAKTKYWLKELGLWYVKEETCWKLSGGMQRKVLVAMVLATEAEVVFLDEPTVGLDVESKYTVWKYLRSMSSRGRTILLTTHDMKEAEMVADKVIMLSKGSMVTQGRPKDLISKLRYNYKVIIGRSTDQIYNYPSLDLGGRRIVYVDDEGEVEDVIRGLSVKSYVRIERVGLEDVYLWLVRGEKGRAP